MSPSGLTFSITAISNAIAENLSDDDLNLIGAAFTQMGDTLTTISIQRDIFKNRNNNDDSNTNTSTNDYDNTICNTYNNSSS